MTDSLSMATPAWVALAWQVAWQSTAVLAAGLVASWTVPMRPSRAHRILLAAAIACLIVTPASLIARRFDLGLLPPRLTTNPPEVAAEPGPSPRPTLASSGVVAPPVSFASGRDMARPEVQPIGFNPTLQEQSDVSISPVTPNPVASEASIVSLIPPAWAVLTLVGLLSLLASYALGLRLKAGAAILRDGDLVEAAGSASRSLGMSIVPELRRSRSVRCPVVWCWGRRPVLIVPDSPSAADTGHWSAIFCHELAHWTRRDHLSALAGELLTCLLPWHPLAWTLRGRMADLSELACDDWALAHAPGVSPPDYAASLLGLAVDRRRPLVPSAVSRRSGLGARVRHILEESDPRPRTGAAWNSLLLGLSLGLIVTLTLAQARQARAIVAAAVPRVADDAAQGSGGARLTTIEGTVRDMSGKPLPEAEVLWIGVDAPTLSHVAMPHDHPDYGRHVNKVVARGVADDRGRFTLSSSTQRPSNDRPLAMVVAHVKGLAPASSIAAFDGKPIEIVLQPPVPIVGRLITPGGEPAAGVVVRLETYSNGFWRDTKTARYTQYGMDGEDWDARPRFYPGEFRTDDEGKFVIDGYVPANMFATLTLRHPDYSVEELTVSTGASIEPTPDLAAFSIRPLPREFTHTLLPPHPVVGRITDAETKAPLAGVTVEVTPMRKHGGKPIRSLTDADGRYRVSDREGEHYWVAVYPKSSSGYLPAERGMVQWKDGESDLRIDLPLRRGVVIRGRVIDETNGGPIAGAGVVYQPKRGNPQVRADDDFRSPTITDSEGRFTLTGVRGPGVVVAEGPSDSYIRRAVAPIDFGHTSSLHVHGLARIEVPAVGEGSEAVVGLKRGFTLEARVTGPDGSPLDSVRAWCPELNARLLENWVSPLMFSDGIFRLPGAEPGRTYRVFLLDEGRKFGAVAELKADADRKEPLEVRLAPTATAHGRVLGNDGKPLEGSQILPNIQLVDQGSDLTERDRYDRFGLHIYSMFTDEPLKQVYPADFRYVGLIPGVRYFVMWNSGGVPCWRAIEPLKPGEDRDLGDIRADKKKEAKDGN
ncbi:M56 family metallopeptidase [Isosphaeraceae bacterium EP7]